MDSIRHICTYTVIFKGVIFHGCQLRKNSHNYVPYVVYLYPLYGIKEKFDDENFTDIP